MGIQKRRREERVGEGRGRLAKTQERYKQKANRFRVKEAEEENFEKNGRELEEEKHFGSKRENVNEEKEKSENSVDNNRVSSGNVKTTENTHVSASFTL